MGYVNYSIHFPDPKLLKRIKAAAKAQDTSVSSYIRSAVEKAIAERDKTPKKRAA